MSGARDRPEQLDAVLLGDLQDGLDARVAVLSQGRASAREPLHRLTRGVDDEHDGVRVALVADRVGRAPGQGNDIARDGSHAPHRAVRRVAIADVEGELAPDDVEDLAGGVPVQYGRPATRRHADLDGEQGAAGVGGGGKDDRLVCAKKEALGAGAVDR